MADVYLRSTDGSDADGGTTWALAKATMAGAQTTEAAGDTIYVSQAHSETGINAATNYTLSGTLASPSKVLCVNDAAEPPTALASTAVIATTGANSIGLRGVGYWYGMQFRAGSSTNTASVNLGSTEADHVVVENCVFELGTTGNNRINFGPGSATGKSRVIAKNCQFKFNGVLQGLGVGRMCRADIFGGSIAGSAITTFIDSAVDAGEATFDGVDLSTGAQSMNLITSGATMQGVITFRNCKLPASWSGSLLAGAPITMGLRAEMYNCSASDTNYALWVQDYSGSVRHETTVVRTGGASDGTTPLSWKMATTANAEYPTVVLVSPEIVKWNDTTGSAVTVTVETVTDNVTLTDAECWLEVQYLGTSGVPLSSFISDAKASVLATAANQTTSSETWTTTGLTTPVKQKLSVSFTPQEKGFIHARVHLAKASTTVYVCPKMTVA